MDTLATHPLTKRAEGQLGVDVVVYAAGHFPVARHAQQLSKLGIKSLVSGQAASHYRLPTLNITKILLYTRKRVQNKT